MTSQQARFTGDSLSDREEKVLLYTIQDYISSAKPVPSKQLVRQRSMNVSSATVRNIMSKLEERGYLDHPHTSSGRVPTSLGYRYYVNALPEKFEMAMAPEQVQRLENLKKILSSDLSQSVIAAAQLLAKLSSLLSVIVVPRLAKARLHKLELVELAADRLLMVVSLDSGVIKTVTVEVENHFDTEDLQKISRILNERLHGMRLREIPSNIHEILADRSADDNTGILNIVMESADAIFNLEPAQRFYYGGVEYIALQPEFSDTEQYRKLVSILEDEEAISHLMQSPNRGEEAVSVRIGKEHQLQQIEQCSVVFGNYNMGNTQGSIGLVGPQRMDYGRMMGLVNEFVNHFNKMPNDS